MKLILFLMDHQDLIFAFICGCGATVLAWLYVTMPAPFWYDGGDDETD